MNQLKGILAIVSAVVTIVGIIQKVVTNDKPRA
jgi:hypothetical protein